MTTNAAETFTAAAGYIKEYGWVRGEWGEDGGPRCAGGALMSVMRAHRTSDVDRFLEAVKVWEPLGLSRPSGPILRCTVMNFNDLIADGPGDVVAMFESLAMHYGLKQMVPPAAQPPSVKFSPNAVRIPVDIQ